LKGFDSIQLSKGIAIICILFANTLNYWLDYSSELGYFFSILLTLLEIFGAFLLIFLLSFSVIFTLKKRMGSLPDRENRNKLFKQSLSLILLGIVYNLIFHYFENATLIFWGWNILIFIGFGQFICYYIFKLVRWARLAFGLTIILITPYIRELLFIWKESNIIVNILHSIFVSSTPMYPFLPFVSLWFFSTIFAELIYESTLLESDIANLNAIRSVIKYGLIFIILGFIYSATHLLPFVEPFSYNPNKYPFIDSLPILRGSNIYYIPGIPEAFIKGTIQNIFFITGISLLIIGFIFYLIDHKNKQGITSKILITFGKIAITLVLFQWLFLPIFNQSLNYDIFIVISLTYLIAIGFIIYLWEKYIKTKFSLEWLIKIISKKNLEEVI